MKVLFRAVAALALSLLATTIPARAQQIDLSDPAAVARFAASYGAAQLGTAKDGKPVIDATTGGSPYRITFYGCSNGRSCTTVLFGALYNARGATDLVMGNWNRVMLNGRAYVDSGGGAGVDMALPALGPVDGARLGAVFDTWADTVRRFEQHIGFQR